MKFHFTVPYSEEQIILVDGTFYVDVEAETQEEAKKIALQSLDNYNLGKDTSNVYIDKEEGMSRMEVESYGDLTIHTSKIALTD